MRCSGDGEVVPASDGADVQPAQEATNSGEGSPGGQNDLKDLQRIKSCPPRRKFTK